MTPACRFCGNTLAEELVSSTIGKGWMCLHTGPCLARERAAKATKKEEKAAQGSINFRTRIPRRMK